MEEGYRVHVIKGKLVCCEWWVWAWFLLNVGGIDGLQTGSAYIWNQMPAWEISTCQLCNESAPHSGHIINRCSSSKNGAPSNTEALTSSPELVNHGPEEPVLPSLSLSPGLFWGLHFALRQWWMEYCANAGHLHYWCPHPLSQPIIVASWK